MNKCPFCGAEYLSGPGRANLPMFACGTIPKTLMRDYDCYEREIAALQEKVECLKDLHLEISALKDRLEAWRAYGNCIKNPLSTPVSKRLYLEDKLKDLGEI